MGSFLFFFNVEFYGFFVYFEYQTFIRYVFANGFSLWLLFILLTVSSAVVFHISKIAEMKRHRAAMQSIWKWELVQPLWKTGRIC